MKIQAASVSTNLREKKPSSGPPKTQKTPVFPLQKTPDKYHIMVFQAPKVPSFPFVRNSRPGGGCKSKFFTSKGWPPLSIKERLHSTTGGGGPQSPRFRPFSGKNLSCVQKTPVFEQKTPKPKSFSKNPTSRDKTPRVGTLQTASLRLSDLQITLQQKFSICHRSQVSGYSLQARPRRHINRAGTLPAGTAQCSGSLHY